jgi:predicted phage terminase large subunit-like protein
LGLSREQAARSLAERLTELEETEELEESLASFSKAAWHVLEPGTLLKWNWHLDVLAGYLEAFRDRHIKRLILNIPPGSMKSLLASVFYPSWVWTKDPSHRFLCGSNDDRLSTRDSLKMRRLVTSDWYRERWGHVFTLQGDQNVKTYFETSKMGFRQSQGIRAAISGKRASTLLIDDPHDMKQVESDAMRASVIESWDSAWSSRLNDPAEDGVLIIMQRAHDLDLVGHVMRKEKQKWCQVAIPMRYDGSRYDAGKDIQRPDLNDPRTEHGELMFPARFPENVVLAMEEDLGEYGTASQLQQNPSPKAGGILKKKWWRIWPKDKPLPSFDHIFISYDTAFSEADLESASYSAMTAWGIFYDETSGRHGIMMIRGWHERVDYPTLRKKAVELDKELEPDRHLIEKKASGQSLIQDLRRTRIPVFPYSPDRDKVARAYSIQPMLQAGLVWAPDRKWADFLIDTIARFPKGAPPCSDYTDTVTQALIYLRNGWWVQHPEDVEIEPPPVRQRKAPLYG